jgi:superfamily II DNA helicase RecQ
VKHRGFEEDEEKVQDVIQTIKKVQAETVQRKRPAGVGIVYCSYVETVRQAVRFSWAEADRQCKFVHASLRKNGIAAELYHAKMSDIEKEQVLQAWTSGRVPCIVATIAFGMVSPSSTSW